MAITNFQFPRTTVKQVYTGSAIGADSALPVIVIGPHYGVKTYDDQGEAVRMTGTFTAASGLAAQSYPDKNSTSTIKTSSVKVFVRDGELGYTTGAITADRLASSNNRLTLKSEGSALVLKTSSEATRSSAVKVDVQAGDIVYLTADTTTGSYMVAGVALGATGGYTTLILTSDVPTGAITAVTVCRVKDGYVDAASVTATPTTVAVAANATQVFDGVTGTIMAGKFYCEYSERLTTYVNKLGVITGGSDALSATQDVLGDITPDNPIALATAIAGLESGEQFVYFTAVAEDTAAAYGEAIDFINQYNNLYSVVACNNSTDVVQTLNSYIQLQSSQSIPNYKILWTYQNTPDAIPTSDALTVSSVSSGVVTFATASLVGVDVAASGYYLRTNYTQDAYGNVTYTDYEITATNNDSTVTVASTASITTGSIARIVKKDYSNTDLVQYIIDNKVAADRRVAYVYADGARYAGMQVPNYAVAAALAGMRAYEEPHRPLSNMPVNSIYTTDDHGLSLTQLRNLGSNGVWLVGNNAAGTTISRKQITSAVANDINKDEQSLTTNIDSICIALKTAGTDRVGNSNISPSLITLLRSDLQTLMSGYAITQENQIVGPQLLDYNIMQVAQSATVKDRVYARIKGTPPKPFNEFDITFYFN